MADIQGWSLAVLILFVFSFVGQFFPSIQFVFFIFFLLGTPWLINASLRFRSRMVSYRNIRFNWRGNYWGTFKAVVLWPWLGLLTLGILAPLAMKKMVSYMASNHSLGTTNFFGQYRTRQFILPVILMVLTYFLLLIPFVFIIFLYSSSGGEEDVLLADVPLGAVLVIAFVLMFLVGFLIAKVVYIMVMRTSLNHLQLHEISRFNTDIKILPYLGITVSNIILITLSFGLLIPWARVRLYRYFVTCISLNITGDTESFVSAQETSQLLMEIRLPTLWI